LLSQVITGSNPAGVSTTQTITASVSTTNGTVLNGGAIVNTSSFVSISTGTIPNQTDLILYNVYFTASYTGTNITQSGVTFSYFTATSSLLNRAGTSTNFGQQQIFYHLAGTFGLRFPTSANSNLYCITATAATHSLGRPTGSVAAYYNLLTSGFTASFTPAGGAPTLSDPTSGSLIVYSL
jgi:hypothetical protein